jgi:REP element-mobilizing transposase RayT
MITRLDALLGVPTNVMTWLDALLGVSTIGYKSRLHWRKMSLGENYRDESRRLNGWDYSSPGTCFITICTQFKRPFFGQIKKNLMVLSQLGEIALEEWIKSGTIRKNVKLDEFVFMPNHFHGIIILQSVVGTPRRGVHKSISMKHSSLGTIIGQFKSACTKRIRASGYKNFGWQSRFYDHIIRDELDLNRIRKYIQENPLKWALDEYFVEERKARN